MAITADGARVDKTVNVYNDPNQHFFYGYVSNCFDPLRFLVASTESGEDSAFQDAYDWLLCDPAVENVIKVDTDPKDFIATYGYGHEFVDAEDLCNQLTESGQLHYNDNGTLIDDESVMLSPVKKVTLAFDEDN